MFCSVDMNRIKNFNLGLIINNYKTSIVPISSKTIELGGAPSAGVGQTQSYR